MEMLKENYILVNKRLRMAQKEMAAVRQSIREDGAKVDPLRLKMNTQALVAAAQALDDFAEKFLAHQSRYN